MPEKPLPCVIIEEIALDGLEGITLNDLFKRILHRFGTNFQITPKIKSLVWSWIQSSSSDVDFFQIPESRPDLQILTRNELDAKQKPENPIFVYRFNPIEAEGGIRGSCQDFEARTKVMKESLQNLSCDEVIEKYGQNLVIVASQRKREEVLMPIKVDKDLTIGLYCALEKVGRSREVGELITGPFSVTEMLKSCKSGAAYAMSLLIQKKLIVKQDYNVSHDTAGVRSLYHLPQFYKEYRLEYQILLINAINYLKEVPRNQATLQEIKDSIMGDPNKLSKVIKHPDFRALVDRYQCPYREHYPNATAREWQSKNKTEKTLQMVKLKNPDIETHEIFNKKKAVPDAEDESDEFFLDTSKRDMSTSVLRQVYCFLEAKGAEGITQTEIQKHLGLTKLGARTVMRNIDRMNLIDKFMIDVGRQKVTKFILKKYKETQKPLVLIEKTLVEEKEEDTPELPVEESSIYEGINLDSVTSKITFSKSYNNVSVTNVGSIRNLLQNNAISSKTVQRCNQIIRLINQKKVINYIDLYRFLLESEKRAGYKENLDRKSLKRLLGRLAADDYLKFLTLKVEFKEREFVSHFIVGPEVTESDETVTSIIQMHKAKFAMKNVYDEHPMLSEMRGKKKQRIPLPDTELSQFSCAPKFIRMRNLHEFLYHAIRVMGQNQEPLKNKKEIIDSWVSQHPTFASETLMNELPNIYSEFLDWRTFVEPAVPISGTQNVFLMESLIYNMPLSIFLTLTNVDLRVPELKEVMLHPIKRHVTLKHSPNVVRAQLGYYRGCSYNIVQVAKHLAYIGLVQFVNVTAMKPEMTCIYLNSKATLYDTVSSKPAYHKIEEKEYPRREYVFDELDDVERYWTNMVTICADTKLNSRNAVDGKDILIETVQAKKDLEACLMPRNVEKLEEMDNGEVPGDRLGAAGLDSALYSHLQSKWVKTGPTKEESKEKKKLAQKKKLMLKEIKSKPKKIVAMPKIPNKNRFIRKVETRKPLKRIRTAVYDDVDKAALKQMANLRVSWSEEEDQTLLVCKLAIMYLRPRGPSKNFFPSVFRDILHWRHSSANSKTTKACQRRLSYMLKSREHTKTILHFCLAELRENESINKRFGEDFLDNLKQIYSNEKDYIIAFRTHLVNLAYLLSHLYRNLSPNTENGSKFELPWTVEEFKRLYNRTLTKSEKLAADPMTTDAIETFQIEGLIHSSMCSMKDKTSWNLQLFDIYKNYSDETLRKALTNLRARQLVSLNKRVKTKHLEPSRSVSSLPLHLSITYLNHMMTKLPYETIDQVFHTILDFGASSLSDPQGYYKIHKSNTGTAILIAEIINKGMIKTQMEPPKLVLQMEKVREEHFASYERIYPRFQDLIRHMKINEIRPEPEPGPSSASNPSKCVRFNEETTWRFNPSPIEVLMKFDSSYYHFFCLLRSLHQEVLSQTFFLDDQGRCSFNCVLFHGDIIDAIIAICYAHKTAIRNIYARKGLREKTADYLQKNFVIKEETLMYFYGKLMEKLRKNQAEMDLKDIGSASTAAFSDCNDILELAEAFVNAPEAKLTSSLRKIETTRTLIFDRNYAANDENDDEDDRQYEMTDKVHKHADIFRVNLGTMTVNLLENQDRNQVEIDEFSLPKCLMFLSNERRDEILNEVKRNSIWPNCMRSPAELKRVLKEKAKKDFIHVEKLLEIIQSYGETGVHAPDLAEMTDFSIENLKKYIKILIDHHFILRSGITNVTYIHWTQISPWLVKSYNMKRSERESIPTCASSLTNIQPPAPQAMESEFGKRMAELDTEAIAPKSKRQKVESPENTLNTSKAPREAVSFVAKPWIRVNGSINRRVLDKWLGTLLLHLIYHPGTLLKTLGERFNFLTLMQIRDCLEILQEIGCVALKGKKKKKVGLFDDYEDLEIEEANDFHEIDEIFISTHPDAIVKFTLFVGKKKYSSEFV